MVVLSMRMTSHGENLQDRLSRINERLAKHQGEFVLMVENEEKSYVHGGPGYYSQPHDYHLTTKLSLGIVSGDSLVERSEFEHAVPTDGFTVCQSPAYEHPVVIKYQDNMHPFLKMLLYHLDRPLKTKNPLSQMMAEYSGKELVELELHIGNEEVSAWTDDDQHKLLVLAAMAKPLKRSLPRVVQPKLKAAIAEQRQAALQEIARPLEQYFALWREIRAQGKPADIKVPSLSVLHDEEILISAEEAAFFGPLGGMNEKLEELKREIRSALADARQFGLRHKDIIEALSQEYRRMLIAHLKCISTSGRKKKTT